MTKPPINKHPSYEPWWPDPVTRERKPTLRSVLAQAARAGVSVAAVQVNVDGSIVITPGTPADPLVTDVPTVASEWN